MNTPRCATTGCGSPAAVEVLRGDRESFLPALYLCELGARGVHPVRKLKASDFGLAAPIPASRSGHDEHSSRRGSRGPSERLVSFSSAGRSLSTRTRRLGAAESTR